jgi:hypothetical protein
VARLRCIRQRLYGATGLRHPFVCFVSFVANFSVAHPIIVSLRRGKSGLEKRWHAFPTALPWAGFFRAFSPFQREEFLSFAAAFPSQFLL